MNKVYTKKAKKVVSKEDEQQKQYIFNKSIKYRIQLKPHFFDRKNSKLKKSILSYFNFEFFSLILEKFSPFNILCGLIYFEKFGNIENPEHFPSFCYLASVFYDDIQMKYVFLSDEDFCNLDQDFNIKFPDYNNIQKFQDRQNDCIYLPKQILETSKILCKKMNYNLNISVEEITQKIYNFRNSREA